MTRPLPTRPTAGFTIVELLVSIAIIAVLISVLLPSLQQAKRVARISVCAGNMRTHGQLFGMYAADCRDFLPPPSSPHRLRQSINSWVAPQFSTISVGTAGDACPDNPGANPRALPNGPAVFYYMGYVPPIPILPPGANKPGSKIGFLDCPDQPAFRTFNASFGQFNENQYRTFSGLTRDFAARNLYSGINPAGANWDCQPAGVAGYIYRGWVRTTTLTSSGVKLATHTAEWSPENVLMVEHEFLDATSSGGVINYMKDMDVHGDGMNLLFHDGHVAFGGKNISGQRPAVYYSYTLDGQTLLNAQGGSSNAVVCNAPGGTSNVTSLGNLNLWKYYENR